MNQEPLRPARKRSGIARFRPIAGLVSLLIGFVIVILGSKPWHLWLVSIGTIFMILGIIDLLNRSSSRRAKPSNNPPSPEPPKQDFDK